EPDLTKYSCFNEFFYRKLKPDARPITRVDDPTVVVSSADCRLILFNTVNDATRIWIKGHHFSLKHLFDNEEMAKSFEGGSLAVFRLAPADYHRFHCPVSGTWGKAKTVSGTYYTVNPVAINENLDVLTKNQRVVTTIDTGEELFGVVGFVAIGALLVGSINFTVEEEQHINKGDEVGYFAYGGSTIVAVFKDSVVKWDDDLIHNSNNSMETLVRMGEQIGIKTTNEERQLLQQIKQQDKETNTPNVIKKLFEAFPCTSEEEGLYMSQSSSYQNDYLEQTINDSNVDLQTHYNTNTNLMTTTVISSAPNHFLLSSYKDNSTLLSTNCYKCYLCKKITDDCLLTCANCVNNGKFCHSKHENCSNTRRNTYIKLLNSIDLDEYHQRKTNSAQIHLQCSDRMYFLQKFTSEKEKLCNEIQIKIQPFLKRRKISDDILVRRKRLGILKQHMLKMTQQLEKDKNQLQEIRDKITVLCEKKHSYKRKLHDIDIIVRLSNDNIQKKDLLRIENEQKLLNSRRQRINELYKYVFPIEEVLDTEDVPSFESTMKAMINNAQQTTVDATGHWLEYDDRSHNDKFRIVASCLPRNGDYAFDK
ncbi:unnamed protein product, partial [Didymodactylos carnosus]